MPPGDAPAKKKRGRPPGSKNRPTEQRAPKKKTGAKAKVVAKAPTKKEHRTGELVRVRSSELRKKAKEGDVDAESSLKEIQKAYARVGRTKGRKADVSKECRDSLKAADAALVNAIEAPLPVGTVETLAYRAKLENVERRWQELSETKSGNIESRKHARDNAKSAEKALAEAIENSTQLALPGLS